MQVGFGIMIPDNVEVVSDLIKKYSSIIKMNSQYYIGEFKIYGVQDVITLTDENNDKHDFYAYVYFDHKRYFDEVEHINDKISFYESMAHKRKRYTNKMKEYFLERGIIITKTDYKNKLGQNFEITVDYERVNDVINESGFFIILSNRLLDCRDMICIAKSRDVVEKSFMFLKSYFDLSRTGVHSSEAFNGKMFIYFIALIILQSFRWFTKELLKRKTSETTKTLINELNKYQILQKKDGSWIPIYAMNKKQKEILECFSITEETIIQEINSIYLKAIKDDQKTNKKI